MIISEKILDELSEQAKASQRLRMAYDLRTTPDDGSQRMLSAIEPGTQVPIHRHRNTSETIMCIRGHFKQLLYDDAGNVTDEIDMLPGGCIVNGIGGRFSDPLIFVQKYGGILTVHGSGFMVQGSWLKIRRNTCDS